MKRFSRLISGLLGRFALLICLVSYLSGDAAAEQSNTGVRARMITIRKKNTGIQGLSIGDERPSVFSSAERGFFVHLHGKFHHESYSLLMNSVALKPRSSGDFDVWVPISGKSTLLQLLAIGPYGDVQQQSLVIWFPEWAEMAAAGCECEKNRKFLATGGLGLTSISYSQTGAPNISEIATTGKFSLSYRISPPHWDLGLSGYATLLPITTSPSSNDAIRFIGFNFRTGYHWTAPSNPWRISLNFGWFYTTTIATGNIGFTNMSGPQVSPTLERGFSDGSTGLAYLKYSPIISDGQLTLSNRELATGVAWARPFRKCHTLFYSLDFSKISIQVPSQAASFSSTSVSLGVGYGI